ncbi:MAG TPA: flagellar export chaperone FliS [Burkholderiaceae bacterium]|nr:flagellar export chaperone FliS [Burkholderiaceae bacterium]
MTYPRPAGALRRRSAQAYANVGLETKVLSANPQQLISLLFQGALAAIAKARLYMQNGDIAGRGTAISKAIDIVDSGLKASVDTDVGGEVAENLVATYELINRHLLLANLNADEKSLETAEIMLKNISEAWQEVTTRAEATPPAA